MSGWGDRTGGSSGSSGQVIPIGSTQVPFDTATPDPTGSYYNAVSAVPTSVLTNILTFTVPAVPVWHLIRVEFGGLNISRYWLYFDGVEMSQYVTWFNGSMTGEWDFINAGGGGLAVAPGTVIRVKTQHGRPYVADFFARLSYIEVN